VRIKKNISYVLLTLHSVSLFRNICTCSVSSRPYDPRGNWKAGGDN